MMPTRYAIYFAPDPASELWRRGSRWLGRDAATDRPLVRPTGIDLGSLRGDRITETPATYGFHATLKAPFRLAEEETPGRLIALAADFADRHASVILPGLEIASIGDFVALVPKGDATPIGELAAACVTEFDPLRAQPDAGDLARCRRAGLSRRQTELLDRWGYPYVMDEFRFHMTLTGSLSEPERQIARRALGGYFADIITAPLEVDAIAIFTQPAPDEPFHILKRFFLTGR